MSDLPSDAAAAATVAPRNVTVIVPVHRAGEMLRACLAALAAASPRAGQVLVVADGPGDGTWRDVVEAADPSLNLQVLELPHRVGAAAARNAAVPQARGSVLFFVDADVTIAPDAVAQVVAAFTERPALSAVFGSYDDAPGAVNFVAQYKGLLNHYVHQHAREEAFTFWTALGAIRKAAFVAVGGFDESVRVEDIELGYRLRANGLRIAVRKTLLAKHQKRWTAGTLIRSDLFDRAIPWTLLMLRTRSAEPDLNLDVRNRASVACVALLLLSPLLLIAVSPAVAVVAPAILIGVLLVLNAPLYRFFLRKRGVGFTVAAVPWHWLYYLYGGIGFGVGLLLHMLRRTPVPDARPMQSTKRLEAAA